MPRSAMVGSAAFVGELWLSDDSTPGSFLNCSSGELGRAGVSEVALARVTALLIVLALAFAWSIGAHYTGAVMGMPHALKATQQFSMLLTLFKSA